MSNRDWLSLTEIARLWSDETGEREEALERDLDAWFSEFVAREPSQQPGSPGRDGDTTNLLMAMLGGRHLQRETFAIYCEERGHEKPHFWFAGGAEDREPDPPLRPNSPSVATIQALHGYAPEARPAQRQFEEAWSEPGGYQFEPAQPAPEIGFEASCPAADRPAPSESAATSGLAGGRLPGRKATRLADSLVLALSLLAVGFVLGQGGTESSKSGSSVAGQGQLTTPLVSSLRGELDEAQRQIANLGTALEASEQVEERLSTDLLAAQQVLDMARDTGQFDTEVASLNIETSGCKTYEHTLYVQADRVNVREGPGTSYGVILQINKGRSLVKLDRRGEWFWMTYEVGETTKDGWIHSSLVSTDCL